MKIQLFTLLFLTGFASYAQDDAMKMKIAKETCECISAKDLSQVNSIEMSLGICMIESLQNNNIEIDVSDKIAMRTFGEKIGVKMAPLCPEVFNILAKQLNANKKEKEEGIVNVKGKIKSIDDDSEFIFVNLKEDSGKEHRLIWLRYFAGSDDFLENPRKMAGKNVSISFRPIECYRPKTKEYINFKEITNLAVE